MVSIQLKKPDSIRRYSPLEQRIFALLPRDGSKVSTEWLAHKIYGKRIPMHGRVTITGTLRALVQKAEQNKEPFRICRSEAAGPYPLEVWLER
jgi:hypothetical protein